VLWAEVDAAVEAGGRWSLGYLAYFVVASVIAAIAVLVDSSVLVVGAMVVGPEFGPVVAISLALERGRWRLLRRASAALGIGTLSGLAAAFILALALRVLGRIPDSYTTGVRPLTRFVSEPDEFSAIVACAAAVAGVLALTHERAGTLVGVLVSVTTLPAIAAAGVALAVGDGDDVVGSLAQLAINVTCLARRRRGHAAGAPPADAAHPQRAVTPARLRRRADGSGPTPRPPRAPRSTPGARAGSRRCRSPSGSR
jgi:uncharacterized hydrophobic protein (TIGR00271 family)